MPGPAPGRPMIERVFVPCSKRSKTGACRIEEYGNVSPAAAVP